MLQRQAPGRSGHHFFVWTLIMLGVSGLFSPLLATQGLWRREWRQLP
jgi:hypothetical protein